MLFNCSNFSANLTLKKALCLKVFANFKKTKQYLKQGILKNPKKLVLPKAQKPDSQLKTYYLIIILVLNSTIRKSKVLAKKLLWITNLGLTVAFYTPKWIP